MATGLSLSASDRVILRDAGRECWVEFSRPRSIITAKALSEVIPGLRQAEEVVRNGLYAAGFVSYEAAPAFDPALTAKRQSRLPLLWFGLYEKARPVELPTVGNPTALQHRAWRPSVTRRDYRHAVRRIRQWIRAGETYQVNYTYRLRAPLMARPLEMFCALAAAQESPYSALVETEHWALCSASPELFFILNGRRIRCGAGRIAALQWRLGQVDS